MDFRFLSIGHVVSQVKFPERVRWEDLEAEVVIDPEWGGALDGIEEFSHIWVLFYMHHAAEERAFVAKVHPMGQKDLPLVGSLVTRTPHRPNPLALTAVRLLRREENVLVVRGLDAYDGTPVLDIKPYLPPGDLIPEAVAPDWVSTIQEKLRNRVL
ncbi:MAG: tRNA (N6-threonylcarbamoyladenosine(37)-N6)-methyltransferase TrmO [Chloroflexota bacterium]|nr:tRNA (N6-threonylcarbamoyladenosine(37)-N6)-methyltransferase TrmO [Chloroflexota bacterium]